MALRSVSASGLNFTDALRRTAEGGNGSTMCPVSSGSRYMHMAAFVQPFQGGGRGAPQSLHA